MKWLIVVPVLVVLAALLAGQFGLLAGRRPSQLGVQEGRLKPPSRTPNSVSSQAQLYPDHPQRNDAQIEPLPFKAGGAEASLRAVKAALATLPGVALQEESAGYLRAQARTRWLGFVDDLEFWANPQRQAVELRGASRLGRKDFGVNRARMEALRAAYQQQPG
jgi:uncharacterized protein (DUF1499 family)